jgi:uncharacterized membrane protein
MDSTTIVTIILAILSSSVIVAVVNWIKERDKDDATTESLSVDSLKEALLAVRQELKEVRQDLEKTRAEVEQLRRTNAKLVKELERYGGSGSDTI